SPPSQDTGEGLLHHQLKGVTSSTVVRYQLSQSNNGEGVTSLHEFSNAVGQQGNTFAASKDDNSKSEYHGNDIDGHHSIIDPTSWAQRIASPPRSRQTPDTLSKLLMHSWRVPNLLDSMHGLNLGQS
ncbi:hypothetical protein B296_00030170, partial [Ensete ventricosum]